ncbi:hypothetical protein [Hyphococcus sp.]|uniref:hypothetical protein n=1 Tax=Hyphococcus sp. TaxID=2038636 RepID=UPI003CCC40C7
MAKRIGVNVLRTAGSAILFFSLMFVFHSIYGMSKQIDFSTEAQASALVASAMITSVVFFYFFYFIYQVIVLTVEKRKRLLAYYLPLVVSVILAVVGGYLYFFDEMWRGSEVGVAYIGYGAVGAVFSSLNYKIFIR